MNKNHFVHVGGCSLLSTSLFTIQYFRTFKKTFKKSLLFCLNGHFISWIALKELRLKIYFSVKNKIKQFVVMNCSKERPGSIVTETLKNGILIPIVTSKEPHFNADFKYISFIKISYTHQKLRAWKICLILENRGKHPLKVIES